YLYAIPYKYYEENKIRRYGFRGSSHRYCLATLEKVFAKKPAADFNAITVHLGNGCSLCAIEKGKSVDTSMGLTPLEGVIMGTRSGNVDTAAILTIMENTGMTANEASNMLNKKSGLLGISGVSNDMRDMDAAAAQGNERAKIAIKMFSYRVRKYIGAYMAVLGKVDYIAFAGGIGENNPPMRASILEGLESMGIILDPSKNDGCRKTAVISADNSPITVCVINTDEEIIIARDTVRCIQK
ncbi:MAG: acetate/propionate family kinase, partial [Candidatus Sumerlaeales bacterium]|nr:acetate/propionate family kinase [Candidatus Sumerlaeales bacterium]